jgi:hypothetical protein
VRVHDQSKSCPRRIWLVCGLLLVVLAGISLAKASCVTELNTIVKTPRGVVKVPGGEVIGAAEIEVTSSSEETIYKTKSARDGSFLLAVRPGKYRVEVWAEGYLRLLYVVDLRGGGSVESFDVPMQNIGQCHDVRIITSSEGKSEGKEDECSSEVVRPNLVLRAPTIISGQVKDETGAPLRRSQIELKKLSNSILQPARLDVKTDEEGRFTFDEAEPGDYRLLASPNRAFAQPEKLDCYGLRNCRFEIVLNANATDLPCALCPVQ